MKEIAQNKIIEHYVRASKERRKYSNCQLMVNQLEEKVKLGHIVAYELQHTLLIIENMRGLYYLYYMSESWEWLDFVDNVKQKYQNLIISIVQKEMEETERSLSKKGYSVYKKYERLRCEGYSVNFSNVNYCNEKDSEDLRRMMDRTFDILSDHIPTDKELEEFISNKQIICIRQEDKVKGFIIFQDKGKTSYIRMVCVDADCQGKGFANDLMKMYFGIHTDCTSFTLWYDVKNSKACTLYKKWNYKSDQLYNLIYVI